MEKAVGQEGYEMGFFNLFKKTQRKIYSDGVVIEYKIEPPNFREPTADEFGEVDICGSCKFCGDIRSKRPVCAKYGVHYEGLGCLTKAVCDDFKSVLFDLS